MRWPVAVVLFGVAAAGCATKADVETLGTSLRADIDEIRADNLRLLSQIRGELDSLEAAEARRESTGRGEFDRRVSALEDMFEEMLDLLSQNNQLLNDLYQSGPATSGGPGMAGPGGTDPLDPAGPALGQDEPSQFYGLALDQFRAGNLETARGAFRSFLAEAPDHELAPDAQYYVARTYEEAEDPGNALEEYRRVTEMYPDSDRAPTALWRRGRIEVERGNTAIARRLFQQILSGYPNSPEAPLARQELDRIGD